mmetsp:Transcript_18849/g.54558  ORF Transcript_18849/g.54558 Transcript_18849/m.54558 type:complete len:345 (-) Transcript_18849:87-1121(-)
MDRLLQFPTFQIQLGTLRHGRRTILLEFFQMFPVPTQGIRLGLHGSLDGSNGVVRHPRLLVKLTQYLHLVGTGVFDLVQRLPGPSQFLIVQSIFHRPPFTIELLVACQFLLFSSQFVQSRFDVGEYVAYLIDRRTILLHFPERFGLLFVVDRGARHLLEELKTFGVGHGTQRIDFSLLYDKVRIGFGETGTLQQTHDFVLVGALALEEEFVLLVSHRASQHDLVGIFHRETIVGIVEYYFHEGVYGRLAGSLVEEGLTLLRTEGIELGTQQRELDRIEQVGLAGAVPADDHVGPRRERVNFRLLPERAEVRYRYLLDVHGCRCFVAEISGPPPGLLRRRVGGGC